MVYPSEDEPTGALYRMVRDAPGDPSSGRLDGTTTPVLRLDGIPGSERTGLAFAPSGTRLYFGSQRSSGVTYEVTGDWCQF